MRNSNKHVMIKSSGFIYYSPSRGLISVSSDLPRYRQLLARLFSDDFSDAEFLKAIANASSPDIEEQSAGAMKVTDAGIEATVDGNEVLVLPADLHQKVKQLIAAGAEYKHLENFWRNCLRNPNRGSIEQLYSFISRYLLTITEDGCFIAYKYVKSDYLDAYSGSYDNTPGKIVSMPREGVTFDPNIACSTGLHVGAFSYVRSFMGNRDYRIVAVKVSPEHVVSVPFDYDCQKIRVCQYTVLSDWVGLEEHSAGVVDDDMHSCQDTALPLDREWSSTEMLAIKRAADNCSDLRELPVISEHLAKRMQRRAEDVLRMLKKALQEVSQSAVEKAPWERVGSTKLNVDRRRALYEMVEKYGHEWGKIFEHMQNMFDNLDVSVDTLRKLSKRMGL